MPNRSTFSSSLYKFMMAMRHYDKEYISGMFDIQTLIYFMIKRDCGLDVCLSVSVVIS